MKNIRLVSSSIAAFLLCSSSFPTPYVIAQNTSNVSPAHTKGRSYYEERGDIVWEVPTHQPKVIALTFDDGPDTSNTPAILDFLRNMMLKRPFPLLVAA